MSSDRVTIALVVEGHGEVSALQVLVRRIAHDLGIYNIEIGKPNRVGRSTLATAAGLVRAVNEAAYRVGTRGGVLVLFDADDDCPKKLVEDLLTAARGARTDKQISLVIANREFEAWFLAAADSLAGRNGLPRDFTWTGDPEAKRDAKGVLNDALKAASGHGHPYKETVDQERMAAVFDLAAARKNSPSFDKLYREVASLCGLAVPHAAEESQP